MLRVRTQETFDGTRVLLLGTTSRSNIKAMPRRPRSFSAGAFSATRTKVPKGHGKPIAKTASLADANESLQREWELLPRSCSPLGDRTRAPVLLAPQSGGELRFVLRVTARIRSWVWRSSVWPFAGPLPFGAFRERLVKVLP